MFSQLEIHCPPANERLGAMFVRWLEIEFYLLSFQNGFVINGMVVLFRLDVDWLQQFIRYFPR